MTRSSFFTFSPQATNDESHHSADRLMQADLWDVLREWWATHHELALKMLNGETVMVKILEVSVRSSCFYCVPVDDLTQKELFVGARGNRFVTKIVNEWLSFEARHINTYQFGDRKIFEVLYPSELTRFVSLQSLF